MSRVASPRLDELTGLPVDEDGPVFKAPWEATAFALALKLHEAGHFSWREWAQALSEEIARAQAAGDPDLGDTYYRHWLNALEKLVQRKGLAPRTELERRKADWRRAYLNTPHGQPVSLDAASKSSEEGVGDI